MTLPDISPRDAAPIIQGLIKAHGIISDPARHTTGENARDINGNRITPYSTEAVCFCSIGVVEHVFRHSYAKERHALEMLKHFMCPDSLTTIHGLNDLLTHDQLMDRWSKALTQIKEHYRYDQQTVQAA